MPEQDAPGSDDLLDQRAGVEMPPQSGANDAPSESATAPVSGPSPSEVITMEVDEGATGPPPASRVSQEDDDLLDENKVLEVDTGLAHLTVSSPSRQAGEGEDTSITEAPPPPDGNDV